MENSWIFPELFMLRRTIESIIPRVIEKAADNPLWEHIADDLIDAKQKIEAAIKVKEESCA